MGVIGSAGQEERRWQWLALGWKDRGGLSEEVFCAKGQIMRRVQPCKGVEGERPEWREEQAQALGGGMGVASLWRSELI